MSGDRSARDGIIDTLVGYCQLLDDGRFDEWGDLFDETCRFTVMGRTYDGRDAIVAFITAAQTAERRGRHSISLPRVVVDAFGGRAQAWTDYVFIDRTPAITSMGRYHDELQRGDDGRWRFTVREIVFQGDEATATQPPPG